MLVFDKTILRDLKKKEKIHVGFSGGCDSTALLHFMVKRLKLNNVVAIHVNHKINKGSDSWENFCRDFAKDLKISFISFKVPTINKNIEAEARNYRLRFFSKISDHIVLAHHQDDVIENYFLSLLRKKRPKNYYIKKINNIPVDNKIITVYRPFLKVSKKDILKYCANNKLSFVFDYSNNDVKYDRNWFRNFISKANERFDFFNKRVMSSLEYINELSELSQILAKIDYEKYFKNDEILVKEMLKDNISFCRFKNLVLYLMEENNIRIEKKHFNLSENIYRKGNNIKLRDIL